MYNINIYSRELNKKEGKKEMKRRVFLLMLIAAMLLASCAAPEESTPTMVPTQEATEALATPEVTPEPTPEPEPDLNDPLIMAGELLNNPRVINGEDLISMAENNGGQFAYIDIKRPSDDGTYFIFAAENDGIWFRRNESLKYDNRNNGQAVLVKFMTDNTDMYRIMLLGNNEMYMQFENGEPYNVNFNNVYMEPYSNFKETDFRLEANKWYWALLAVDNEGFYRSAVWEDGNYENYAYYEDDTNTDDSQWNLVFSVEPHSSMGIMEYFVLDYDSFTDNNIMNDRSAQMDNEGGGEIVDPMPIVEEYLSEPNVLYEDSLDTLPQTGYSNYSDVDEKRPGDGFEFVTGSSTNGFSFLTNLLDVVPESERKDNYSQAVLVNFKTNNPSGLQFNLKGKEMMFISFMNNGEPAYGIMERPEHGMTLLRDVGSNEFMLESDTWYYALIAVNINGKLRFKIWREDAPETTTDITVNIVEMVGQENRSTFAEQPYTLEIWIGNNSQFNLKSFKVMDFSEYK